MRRILFVAFLATLLASGCQKTEIINPADGNYGLTFTTDFGKLTKAADADSSGLFNLKNQDFRVWAYAAHDFNNTPEDDANRIYDGMENIKVFDYIPTGAQDVSWKADKQYFWPGVSKSLYFFAISDSTTFLGAEATTPTNVKIKLTADQSTNSVPEMTISDYVVNPENPNNDLMVANFIKQHQGQADKKVNLKFNHALAKVQFLFKTNEVPATGDPIAVFVQKLEVGEYDTDGTTVVDGLKSKGTLTVTPKETTQGTEPSATASGTAEVSTLTIEWDEENMSEMEIYADDYNTVPTDFPTKIDDVAVTDATDKTALKLTTTAQEFATWLVLPQDVLGKKVKVTYLINGRQFANEFSLDAFAVEGATKAPWAVNQYIKYIINLSPNLITFTADVTPWNPEQGNGVSHTN